MREVGAGGTMKVGTLVALTIAVLACSGGDNAQSSDSAFAGVQRRGQAVMGVDQYTSQHVFEPLPDGGRIVLQRDEADSAGEAVIREHMHAIAQAFAAGDFTLPGVVHAMKDVPGTQQMREMRDEITYTAQDLPRGGEVVISTRNPKAVTAIHEFLTFQRMDHRAGAHME
jgi:hypothetical protein